MIQRYEKYKDSGVEWIGLIPEGWEVKKLKYLARIMPSNIDKKTKDNENTVRICNYMDVYKNSFISNNIDFMKASASDAQIERFALKENDVIATKDSEDPADIGIPALVVDDLDDVVCGYHLTLMRSKDIELSGKYLFHIFNTHQYRNYLETEANGITRYSLGTDSFANLPTILPSRAEQIAMASFLDRKTSEIDRLIAKKEKLITLYEEEKKVIINHAVTRGLDPNVKLKPSGNNWLGNIPEHWEVMRLKYFVSKVGSGVTPKGGASVYQLNGIPLLRSQNIHFDGLRLDDVAYVTQEIHDEMSNSKVFNGDVLLNITGASIGRCYFVDNSLGEANVNQHVCIIRPKAEMNTRYLFYLMCSDVAQKQIENEQTGSGREGLNFESLKNFIFPVTTYDEQISIVEKIEFESKQLNAIIQKFKKQIELYKEYQTTLISEVVTGKIDVRGEVAI